MFILLKKNFQGQQAGTKIDVTNADDAKTLIESGIGSCSGGVLMFGPRGISMSEASSSEAGCACASGAIRRTAPPSTSAPS